MTYLSLFGERLKAARKSLGLNQAQVAESVGVSREYWGRCERGEHMPGGDVFLALANKGVDVNKLLTGEPGGGVTLTGEEQLMLQYFRDASPVVRKAALGALLGAPAITQIGGSNSQHNSAEGAVMIGTINNGKKRR